MPSPLPKTADRWCTGRKHHYHIKFSHFSIVRNSSLGTIQTQSIHWFSTLGMSLYDLWSRRLDYKVVNAFIELAVDNQVSIICFYFLVIFCLLTLLKKKKDNKHPEESLLFLCFSLTVSFNQYLRWFDLIYCIRNISGVKLSRNKVDTYGWVGVGKWI